MTSADVELIFGEGALDQLAESVGAFRPARVLLVASRRALEATRVLDRLAGHQVHVFSGFRANPVLDDTLAGCRALHECDADLIVGLGGGSAMDTAKLVRLLPADRASAVRVLRGAAPGGSEPAPPLIVVPTTAGTGSEMTQFATVYVDGMKHSLDTPRARPDVAVVDPLLTASCPAPLTLACAFDALAHALESYWSTRSTMESRWLAEHAGRGLVEVLTAGAASVDRTLMSRLSIQAGLAINQTRTTVGHAFAYPLTARHNVPHGLAAVLALSCLLPAAVSGQAPCCDPRGADFLARRLAGLADILQVAGPQDLGPGLRGLIAKAGFPAELGAYGVRADGVEDIMRDALASNRAGNAPAAYGVETTRKALNAAL